MGWCSLMQSLRDLEMRKVLRGQSVRLTEACDLQLHAKLYNFKGTGNTMTEQPRRRTCWDCDELGEGSHLCILAWDGMGESDKTSMTDPPKSRYGLCGWNTCFTRGMIDEKAAGFAIWVFMSGSARARAPILKGISGSFGRARARTQTASSVEGRSCHPVSLWVLTCAARKWIRTTRATSFLQLQGAAILGGKKGKQTLWFHTSSILLAAQTCFREMWYGGGYVTDNTAPRFYDKQLFWSLGLWCNTSMCTFVCVCKSRIRKNGFVTSVTSSIFQQDMSSTFVRQLCDKHVAGARNWNKS